MTQPAHETSTLQALRARNTLIKKVRAQLKGTGLDIRELASHLVISCPGHPEYGRIYITYANGDVSHRQTHWDYLGGLNGHSTTSPDTEPCLDITAVIAVLTGQPATPS